MDEELQLAAWGPDLTVAFPTAKDAAAFASGLVRVAVQPCSLADTPAAAVVAQAAAEAALRCAAAAAAKVSGSCPASPDLTNQPLSAGKRKAEAAGLQTPVVRVSGGGGQAVQGGLRLATARCTKLHAPAALHGMPSCAGGSWQAATSRFSLLHLPAQSDCPLFASHHCPPQPLKLAIITPTCSGDLAALLN